MRKMNKVFASRLRELRHNMNQATTTSEKEFCANEINECLNDMKKYRSKMRLNIIKSIIAGVVFVGLITLVLFLVSMLRTESSENQSIGHAVSENAPS